MGTLLCCDLLPPLDDAIVFSNGKEVTHGDDRDRELRPNMLALPASGSNPPKSKLLLT